MARKAKPADQPADVFRLKVVLSGFRPPIWRRIEVRDCTLEELHYTLQDAMGWYNCHLHTFTVGGVEYGESNPDWDVADERRVKLSRLAKQGVKKIHYTYDMGDSWEHEITFQKSVAAEPGAKYPRVIGGARACPPEDCGGVWGYGYLLEILADPTHEEHQERLEWVGGEPIDPEAFDLDAINARLGR